MKTLSREARNEYQRGYAAARRTAWPEHKPPHPPHELIRKLAEASRRLRDQADDICSTLMEDDEFVKMLGPKIDALDDVNKEITAWLYTTEPEP